MLKKTAAVLATMIIVLSSFGLTVSADERGSVSLIQTSYADKGGTFTVEVMLDSNPGIKSMSCNVRFNVNELNVKSVSDSELLGGFFYTTNSNILQLTWTGSGKNVTSTGSLATITFTAVDTPAAGSIVYASVSASDSRGISVMVDGNTTILNFGANQLPFLPQPLVTTAEATGALPNNNAEETEEFFEEEEMEEFFDETTAPAETEPPTTTPEPTTTPAPTTTKKSETTKKRETEAPTTTPEPTTELITTTPEPATTTEPTTEPVTTTEATTTTDALILGVTSAPDEGEEFAEAYTEDLDNKTANRGTILLALIALALTGVVVVAIELYRRRR